MKKKVFNISRRSLALTLALALVVGFVFMIPTRATDTSELGALIDYFQANDSAFTLTTSSRFFLAQEPTDEVTKTVQLAQSQFAADELPSAEVMDIVWGNTNMVRDGDILIKMADSIENVGAEGYKLEVTSYATVTALDVRGLLYGLNMLQKHFRNANATTIKGFTAYDTPDTAERTVQLDCARKYFSVNYICNFIKEISWMGYNTLQLHFSEDGGFRADLWDPNYYVEGHFKPENDFTWLCGSHVQSWVKDESDNGGENYQVDPDAGYYLTTEELIQIINTCKEYHIDIIPSFDSPAHMDYINWKFEQHYLENTGYTFYYNGTPYAAADTNGCINYSNRTGDSYPSWPYYTTMDIRDDTTRGKMSQAFVFSIYKDMADFFKYYAGSTKFNVGADEVNLFNSYIKSEAWSYSLFPGYINEINTLLKSKGYTVRMFNDFIDATALESLDDDIQILYWNSNFNSISNTYGTGENYQVKYVTSGTKVYKPMLTVDEYEADGRILYNCINLHTYYVLRVPVDVADDDARSQYCRNWEFYAADETSIYNKWTPNNIRKDGDYTEADAIVSDAQLGGAYFLTWNDYAAVNTETEIWNGVKDTLTDTGETYSLRKRMWSNSIKQWNWDINDTDNGGIDFDTYGTLRDTLGDFPGLADDTYLHASRAKATTLPASTEPIHLADHTALDAALATKIAKGEYTDASYSAYLTAYNEAVRVNSDNTATAEALGKALDDLNNAIAQLKIRTNTFTVTYKTEINGTEYVIDSVVYDLPDDTTKLNLYVPSLNGYKYLSTDGAIFTPNPSGDGSGYITGTVASDDVITIWYENTADTSRLNDLIAEAITEQGDFTYSSWLAYTTALNNARSFTLNAETRQNDIDALVEALENARSALVVDCAEPTAITVEKVSSSFLAGQQVGLHIHTTANVPSLVITDEDGNAVTLDYCSGEVQTLSDGSVVKYWLVFFTVEFADTYTYTVSYRTTSTEVTVTVN